MDDQGQPLTTAHSGRLQSPSLAALAGLLLPGAGQSYNGRPLRGAFVLLCSPFVVPWLLGSFLARRRAQVINEEGGRFGKGGMIWIILHAWLTLNFVIAIAAGLTMAGILR